MYQKKNREAQKTTCFKSFRGAGSSWKREKGRGEERKEKKKHEKFLTSIIPDTRFPFKSPGHRYYRVKYASHFVHQLPR